MESFLKEIILPWFFLVLLMVCAFLGLLGAITKYFLMPIGFPFSEYRGVKAVIWGLVAFLFFAWPLLWGVINKGFTATQVVLVLVISLVVAILTRKWFLFVHRSRYSGIGINWKYKVGVLVIFLLPFSFYASYPLSLLSIIFTLLLFSLGSALPILNLKATWWFFTLGGRLPLQQQYAWLVPKAKSSQKAYVRFLNVVYLLVMGGTLYVNLPLPYLDSIVRVVSWFVVFGIGVTITVIIKGRNLRPNT